jgi:hypothetical protein
MKDQLDTLTNSKASVEKQKQAEKEELNAKLMDSDKERKRLADLVRYYEAEIAEWKASEIQTNNSTKRFSITNFNNSITVLRNILKPFSKNATSRVLFFLKFKFIYIGL